VVVGSASTMAAQRFDYLSVMDLRQSTVGIFIQCTLYTVICCADLPWFPAVLMMISTNVFVLHPLAIRDAKPSGELVCNCMREWDEKLNTSNAVYSMTSNMSKHGMTGPQTPSAVLSCAAISARNRESFWFIS